MTKKEAGSCLWWKSSSRNCTAFRVKVDDRTEVTPGFKFNDWEMRGVPLRLEVGPKDVEKGSVMAARRDIPGRDGKTILPQENLADCSDRVTGIDPYTPCLNAQKLSGIVIFSIPKIMRN